MRPLSCRGHSRPLTQVIFNRDGDLFFTTAKDNIACIWFTNNCERLGTFGSNCENKNERFPEQHAGAIWCIDVSYNSMEAITGSADQTAKIWDVSTGQVKSTYTNFESNVRCLSYSLDNNIFCATQDRMMQAYAKLWIMDVRSPKPINSWKLSMASQMNTRCKFSIMDQHIHTADEHGMLRKWDWRNMEVGEDGVGESVADKKIHNQKIMDLNLNTDRTMLITASKDKTAVVVDAMTYEVINTYKHPSQVNAAIFSPVKQHILMAGGTEAMEAARIGGKGHFETYVCNAISTEKVCLFRGHFGPVNSIAIHPKGTHVVTGGEEAIARCNQLDTNYLNYKDFEDDLMGEDMDMLQPMTASA